MASDNKKNPYIALSTAALALPGISQGAIPLEEFTIDFRYTNYNESGFDNDVTILDNEGRDRYTIDVVQVGLSGPIGDTMDFSVDFSTDSMTGATPWINGVTTNGDGDEVPTTSASNVDEDRVDGVFSLSKYTDSWKFSGTAGFSDENDYSSLSWGLEAHKDTEDKMNTFSVGFSYSDDNIEPTDSALYGRINSANKSTVNTFLGYTRVINAKLIAQYNFTYSLHEGYLSDPYRLTSYDTGSAADSRPDSRGQLAFMQRYRWYIGALDGALHLDNRFTSDSWNVSTFMLDTSVYKSFFDGALTLAPNFRYYAQSAADFYAYKADSTIRRYMSSDYRLSSYGAITIGGSVFWRMSDSFEVNATIENYTSDQSWSFYGKEGIENSALVDFFVFTTGVKFKF